MMNWRIAFAAFLTFCLCANGHAQFNGCSAGFCGKSAPPAFSLTFTDKRQDTAGGTNITYNSGGNPSIGASDANRVIAVAIINRGGSASVSSVTVNGNNATQVTSAANTTVSMSVDTWSITEAAAGTSGLTSAAIVVNYSASSIRSEIGVYRIVTSSPTPAAGNNASVASGCTSISAAVTIPAGGGALAGVGGRGTGTTTWTSMTADFDDTLAALHEISGTHVLGSGSTTFNPTWASSVTDCELTVAAWGP